MLAVRTAFGAGGETTDTKGAIRSIAGTGFGTILLWGVALGLVGYVLWRLVQAILDPEHKGQEDQNGKDVARRIGYAASAMVYAGLALFTMRILLGGGSGDSGGTEAWTAKLMSQPFGAWLVGLAGAVAIGLGAFYVRRAWKSDFTEELETGSMSAKERNVALRTSQFGIGARGVTFALVGVFLIVAAIREDPQEARGLDGVLQALLEQPFGPYLLGVVALGLIAYGIYCLIAARYRRIG